MLAYFKRQVDEIASDGVLRIYGAILAGSHVLTLAWWLINDDMDVLLSKGREHICWPLLEGCHALSYPSHEAIQVIFALYGVLAATNAAMFILRKELLPAAYGTLVFLTVAKLALMALDFRTRMNQHYMIFFATVAFLWVPHKKSAVRLIIPFFYFWAGTLKLNHEWLSGAAIYGPMWLLNAKTLPWACAYVVFLELFGVWGLWARSKWLFWATLFQLLLFHVMSYPVVGFFYPVLMVTLLAIFPLYRLREPGQGLVLVNRETLPGAVLAGVFSVLQLLPHAFPGDTTLTSEGRLFALHMFDARVECRAWAVVKRTGQPNQMVDLFMPTLVPRIQCDPIVYLSRGKSLCSALAATPAFADLDIGLISKRWSDAQAVTVMDVKDFCRRNPRYALFWPNDWIAR